MEIELLFARTAGVGIEFLCIFAGAECAESYRLRFAPLEDGLAMRAWEQANLRVNRADGFKIPAIQPLTLIQDQTAHRFLLNVIKRILEDELGDFFFAKF